MNRASRREHGDMPRCSLCHVPLEMPVPRNGFISVCEECSEGPSMEMTRRLIEKLTLRKPPSDDLEGTIELEGG